MRLKSLSITAGVLAILAAGLAPLAFQCELFAGERFRFLPDAFPFRTEPALPVLPQIGLFVREPLPIGVERPLLLLDCQPGLLQLQQVARQRQRTLGRLRHG